MWAALSSSAGGVRGGLGYGGQEVEVKSHRPERDSASPQRAQAEPGESGPQLLALPYPSCGPLWVNPVGSHRPGSPVSVARAGQCARAMRRWRGQSRPGAGGRRRCRGAKGELPSRRLVTSRAHGDADEEVTCFLAPERIPGKCPAREGLGSVAQP